MWPAREEDARETPGRRLGRLGEPPGELSLESLSGGGPEKSLGACRESGVQPVRESSFVTASAVLAGSSALSWPSGDHRNIQPSIVGVAKTIV